MYTSGTPSMPNCAQYSCSNHRQSGRHLRKFDDDESEDAGEPVRTNLRIDPKLTNKSKASTGHLNTVWKKDVHKLGSATCPNCGTLIKYGTAGVPNLGRRHLNTQ